MGNIFAALGRFFSSAWRNLIGYLHIAIPEATAVLLNDLLAIADPIVADLQSKDMTGAEKKQQAFTLIQGQAVKAGWDVSVSLINSAIEFAKLKRDALDAQQGNGGVVTSGGK